MMTLFVSTLAASLLLSLLLAFRFKPSLSLSGLIPFAPVLFTAVGWVIASQVLMAPFLLWNEARLMPSYGLVNGYPLYPGPDEGPVNGHIYGPIPVVIYLLVTFIQTPSAAIYASTILTEIMFMAPIAFFIFTRLPKEQSRINAAVLCAVFYLISSDARSMVSLACRTHVDTPAMMFGAFAFAALVSGLSENKRYLLAGVFAASALWSKQLMVPFVAAFPVAVWMIDGRKAIVKFLLLYSAAILAISALVVAFFGPWQNIWYNMVVVPRGHPLNLELASLLDYLIELLPQLWIPVAVIAAVLGAYITTPNRPPVREFLQNNRWLALLPMALAALPLALCARAKVGGNINAYAYVVFFLYLAALLYFLQIIANIPRTPPRVRGAVFGLLGAILAIQVIRVTVVTAVSLNNSASLVPFGELIYEHTKTHPGHAFFPSSPLPVLMAEKKLYHFDYGLFDRELAGMPLTPQQFQAYAPQGIKVLVFTVGPDGMSNYSGKFYEVRRVPNEMNAEMYEVIRPLEVLPETPQRESK